MYLHPQLQQDCHLLGQLELSTVLLLNDCRYPWIILVPQRPELRELIDLSVEARIQLLEESSLIQRVLLDLFKPDKLNVGALGNLVPQLHLHHIARFRDDPAWPAPVWGHSAAEPYSDEEFALRSSQLIEELSLSPETGSGNP